MYINSVCVCVCAHVPRGRWIGLGKLAIGCLCGGKKNTIFDADPLRSPRGGVAVAQMSNLRRRPQTH